MATLPDELRRLRDESRRPRVPRANLVMIAVFLVVASASIALVLGHSQSPALEAFGRLLSLRSWRILQAVLFLSLFAITAIARARRRDRT